MHTTWTVSFCPVIVLLILVHTCEAAGEPYNIIVWRKAFNVPEYDTGSLTWAQYCGGIKVMGNEAPLVAAYHSVQGCIGVCVWLTQLDTHDTFTQLYYRKGPCGPLGEGRTCRKGRCKKQNQSESEVGDGR